ncbi:MAG: PAS domain S-box protein [Syntrophales bacterium]|jgi:PAS domain S-box-containing protein/putative nucleotidyltransferase with HDIG domain|nr:PAS domain S-box protein [Syntrophales bacterium]MCK9528089.1 PAS domain S-box protein [Syntrophales bacterium]MDX9922315.1 PAS domain S-box protein [Syntrophales bacterium]
MAKKRAPRAEGEHKDQPESLPRREPGGRREHDNLYEALARSSQAGVYIVQKRKFQFVNPYIVNYSGYGEDEWIGRDVCRFLHPEDIEKTMENARAMLKGKRRSPYEYRFVSKSGEIRWIMENIISITFRGERAALGNTMDITEEKEAKARLVEAEKLYRSLANHSQTGIFVVQDGKIRFANPHLMAYTGCDSADDLIGRKLSDFVHPDDRKIVAKYAKQMVKGERSYPYEYRIVSKKGIVRWVLETVASIDYRGEPAILGSTIDITQLVEMKEHLMEVQALESTLLAAIPHAVIGLENRRIIFANDSVKNVFGWEPGDMIGQETRILYRSDDEWRTIGERFYTTLEHTKIYGQPFPCRKKDGTDIECMVSSARFGDVLKDRRIVVIYEDITEQRRSERALRESEERYAALVEQAMDGIIIVQDEICLFVNRAMAAMMGYDVRDLTGRPFADLFAEGDRDMVIRLHRRRMAGEEAMSLYEGRLLCKDGSIKDAEIAVGVIRIEGKRAEMGYVRDITFRKRAQEEIKRTVERLKKRLEETVSALASIAEKRDPYTAGHQQRVAELAGAIAREMGLDEDQVEGTIVAATLHDIGKIYEPSEILSKPDVLTDIEFLMMKVHPEIGYDILKNIDFPWPVARIVRQHHERIDGSGYPDGLTGTDILIEARIIAVADVVEAMASHRPYRSALGIESALKEIRSKAGIAYDRDVVNACVRLFKKKGFTFSKSAEEKLTQRMRAGQGDLLS